MWTAASLFRRPPRESSVPEPLVLMHERLLTRLETNERIFCGELIEARFGNKLIFHRWSVTDDPNRLPQAGSPGPGFSRWWRSH